MSSMLNSVKAKLPGNKTKATSPGGSPEGRSIPPEPVQAMPQGDFSQHDAEPAMQAHNLARANKRCDKLEWSTELAKDAQAHAEMLATTKRMEHSGAQGQGENLYMSSGDADFDIAVEAWLKEERNYNGEKIGEGNLGDFGHFSMLMSSPHSAQPLLTCSPAQCLWHGTKRVGMGKATAENGSTYIVARYSPPGNMQGEKPFA